MNPALIPMQAQQNAKMTNDAFADLANWTSSIKKKDEGLKNTTKKGNKVVDEIRSRRARKKHVVKVDSDGSEIESENDEEEEEKERFRMAEEYKAEGNQQFKNKRFQEAVDAYTMAASLDVANAVYPANRAMANMKLNKHAEAEDDCTRALRHDPSYEKALFRRAQCRNILGKLEGAQKDFLDLLKQNPTNKLAKKELNEINQRLHQKVKWTLTRPSNASKISSKIISIKEKNKQDIKIDEKVNNENEIHGTPRSGHPLDEDNKKLVSEINDDDTEKCDKNGKVEIKHTKSTQNQISDVQKVDTKSESKSSEENVSFNFVAPANSFELERDWRSMSDYTSKSKYIRLCETRVIAGLFAPQLPKFLVDICATLLFDIQSDDVVGKKRFAAELLTEISRVPRFKTAVFFLLEKEKIVIKELLGTIKTGFDTTALERAYLY